MHSHIKTKEQFSHQSNSVIMDTDSIEDIVTVARLDDCIKEANKLISKFNKASDHVSSSKSSDNQKKTATKHFNDYLIIDEVRSHDLLGGLPADLKKIPIDKLVNENVLKQLLDGFGYYLANVGEDPFTPQTCQNYFSAVKSVISTIFENNSRISATTFFSTIHVKKIRKGMAQACMVRLEAVSTESMMHTL